jgi:hypothetical protein
MLQPDAGQGVTANHDGEGYMASRLRVLGLLLLLASAARPALSQPAPFDLAGPTLQVNVTHAGATLPISEVPNLAEGDQVSIRADLPADQSAHYLLVAAFLRGSTNPPPANWFFKSETWNKKQKDGLKLTVPKDAQQVLVFLAPETGGDFKTLIDAVRGRPGAFVRASQDLNQATLDRSRLNVYLAAVRKTNAENPADLKKVSPLLARSLTIKLDSACFDKMPELQAPCLMQGQDSLILNDGHSTSIVQALTTGNAADLAMQLSATPQAGFGAYSPYVAAVFDIARIMDSFRTAQYQYIPALGTSEGDKLSLVLNTPPSFHAPQSVMVTALPAVEAPQAPPLLPVDPKEIYCAGKPDLLLPVVGAPLAFSTAYAHDMMLRVKGKNGQTIDLPVRAEPGEGGFVADTTKLEGADLGDQVIGQLRGQWGFASFDGPEFKLQSGGPAGWRVADDDQQALVVGREDSVRLVGRAGACVESVFLKSGSGEPQKLDWKSSAPGELTVTVPLKEADPGSMTLLIKSFGTKDTEEAPLQAYAQASHMAGFTLHAGDADGVLRGARLDEVAGLTLRGVSFKPGALTSTNGADELTLTATDPQASARFKAGDAATAKVALKDGRSVTLKVTVDGARPSVALIAKTIQPGAEPSLIQLTDKDELPKGAVLTFSIRAQSPASFTGKESVEVAGADGRVLTTLNAAGGLTLADAKVAVATLDTAKAFGGSDFGPLQFRIVRDGVDGAWQPLATLVRLPALRELKCPAAADQPCQLSGSDLYLIDQLSTSPGFDKPVSVPEGFTGASLPAPRPTDGRLYVKLHDAPQVVNEARFPSRNRADAGAASGPSAS